jgi:hypothetical protein
VNHWKPAPPHEWSGAWEGRLQICDGHDTKTDVCGHLHVSSAEAERCAKRLAARRNTKPMPSEYYLG